LRHSLEPQRARRLGAAAAWLVVLALALQPLNARAADIKREKLDNSDRQLISIIGEIESGDLAKFRRFAVAYDDAVVFLASDGGSTIEALEIGKIIRIKGYDTFVDETPCNSACALIWLAGRTKYLGKAGRVGFHATYTETNGRKRESGVGNAVVGTYLAQLNLSQDAVVFATSAGPDRLNLLTAANAASVGIPVTTLDDSDDGADDEALGTGTRLYKRVGKWIVGIDDSLGGGCFVLRSYDSSVALRFGIDASQAKYSGYLMLLGADWGSIDKGAEYPVEVTFGKSPAWKVTAHGVEMGDVKGIGVVFDGGSVFDAISTERDVKVNYRGKEVARLDLDGGSAAIDAMVLCQPERPTPGRDPFAR
jgi:hypothetical protein